MDRTKAARQSIGIVAVLLGLSGSLSCSRSPEQSEPIGIGVNEPLASFDQRIQSSATNLSVAANEKFELPVRIENPGTDTWISGGRFPITASYKWFMEGEMLPIEGERTALVQPIPPKTAADLTIQVTAPDRAGNYELRVTLVQEGVTWFMTKAPTHLALPVSVQ